MKRNSHFEIVHIGDDYMALPTGELTETYGGTVVLNETSAFILNCMDSSSDFEEILKSIVQEYNVEEDTARNDLKNVLISLREVGLIEQ